MTDFVGDNGDGSIYGQSSVYATARLTASGFHTGETTSELGQLYIGDYFNFRDVLKFDTSAIPDTATILSAKLRLTINTGSPASDFDVQIIKHDWSSQDPIGAGNMEVVFDACLAGTLDDNIWRNTSGASVDTPYESGELDPTWINKTGFTYYSLRSSRDFSGNTPTGDERIIIYNNECVTSAYRPYLVVTYSTTNISKVSGVLQANISKISGVAIAAVGKISGVDNV